MRDKDRTRSTELSMRWVASFLILIVVSLATADEAEEPKEAPDTSTYDQAIVKFNFNVTSFTTWNALDVTRVAFQSLTDNNWHKTRGNGWRHRQKNRTFVEYRLNKKARVLMRIEGVKPKFFFSYTQRVCEFPFRPMRK